MAATRIRGVVELGRFTRLGDSWVKVERTKDPNKVYVIVSDTAEKDVRPNRRHRPLRKRLTEEDVGE